MKTANDHPFERAGLGRAPFTFDGTEHVVFQAIPGDPSCPLQVGGSCDYCGTGISDFYWVKSADGRRFKVGCDCAAKIAKTYGDRVLGDIKRAANAIKRERKAERDLARIQRNVRLLQRASVRRVLRAQSHPYGYTDRRTGRALTGLDFAVWMLRHAGTSGRVRTCRVIEKVAE